MEAPNKPLPAKLTRAEIHLSADNTSNQPNPAATPNLPAHYKRNLFFIGLLGVAACWWFYYFTAWFEIFSSLLALGGIFSWLAFVAKVLPDDRLKGLQVWVDEKILTRPGAWLCAIAFGILLLGFAACWGTIEVQALRAGGSVRIASASAPKEEEPQWELLSAGGKVRFVVWSPPWARAQIRIKVSGLPDRVETVCGLTRLDLQVPDSFRRPVLLVRPTAFLTQQLANQPETLVVHYEKDERRIEFRGQSLWINCDADVEVPAEMVSSWRAELDRLNLPQLIGEWVNPQSLDRPIWKFQAGQKVEFEVEDKQNNLVACAGSYTVRALPDRADARQVGVLDVKESADAKCAPKSVLSITPQ